MPRKNTKLPGEGIQVMDALVIRQEQSLQQREAEIQRIEALFHFEGPYERFLEESRLDIGRVQHINAIFEQGKSLLRMRAHEGWGGLEKIIEDHYLDRRDAFFYMAIAEKIAPYKEQFEGFGKRALQLLSSLNEKDIKTLAKGGEVAGISLDKPMTTRELAAALQEARKKNEEQKEHYKAETERLKNETERLQTIVNNGYELTKKERAEKAAGVKLDERLKPFNAQLQDAIFAMNRCIDIITEIQRIEAIGFDQLNGWVLKQSADIANITETFTELQDALNDIHIDKGEEITNA